MASSREYPNSSVARRFHSCTRPSASRVTNALCAISMIAADDSGLTQRRLDLLDRLLGRSEPDRGDAEPARAVAVELDVVDEDRLLGGGAEALERDLVDLWLGLAAPDERRVDDHVEDLVDGGHRAPVRLPLA